MDITKLLNSMSAQDKHALYCALIAELQPFKPFLEKKLEINAEQALNCPNCKSSRIYGHGTYRGRNRYHCRDCKKTFNDFTGTSISGIKKTAQFQEYIKIAGETTIRKAACQLEVNVKTIFDWRHKLLSSFPKSSGKKFSGIVECDDKQLNISEKGNKKLDRKAYKRPSDRKTKRGISDDKVSIMVAADRSGNMTMQVAKIGRIDKGSVERTIGNLVIENNVLCSDSHPSIISWAQEKKLEHHVFLASKQHVKDKCYHVQHVNSLDNRYERWVSKFYGIATKYLANYMKWFVFQESIKKSINPMDDLLKAIAMNTATIKSYRDIPRQYENLINLQYS
ncbi:MAG: IS1595 family transposase [Bacteroidales bacterium]|nr:IS1595 family transposase [Bacteroidales bacterium]